MSSRSRHGFPSRSLARRRPGERAVVLRRPVQSTLESRLGRPVDPALADLGRLVFFDPIQGMHGDNSGRRVRELAWGAFGSGGHAVTWDGRDDAGRDVGAGVYLVRLVDPRGMAVQRVTWVR